MQNFSFIKIKVYKDHGSFILDGFRLAKTHSIYVRKELKQKNTFCKKIFFIADILVQLTKPTMLR